MAALWLRVQQGTAHLVDTNRRFGMAVSHQNLAAVISVRIHGSTCYLLFRHLPINRVDRTTVSLSTTDERGVDTRYRIDCVSVQLRELVSSRFFIAQTLLVRVNSRI